MRLNTFEDGDDIGVVLAESLFTWPASGDAVWMRCDLMKVEKLEIGPDGVVIEVDDDGVGVFEEVDIDALSMCRF